MILTVVPTRAGVVRLRAFAGGELIGSCSTRTPAGRRFTCRLWLPQPLKVTARVGVVASLRVKGRVVAVSQARAGEAAGDALALSAAPTRRRPESNRCTRLCRPLRSHSATSPGGVSVATARAAAIAAQPGRVWSPESARS